MRAPLSAIVAIAVALGSQYQPSADAFSGAWGVTRSWTFLSATRDNLDDVEKDVGDTRRSVLNKASLVAGTLLTSLLSSQPSQAAIGTLPEFSNANAILQGLTVNVADQSQQDSMINFLVNAFDFQVLRQRKAGSITDTVCDSAFFNCARCIKSLIKFPFSIDCSRIVAWIWSRATQYSVGFYHPLVVVCIVWWTYFTAHSI
jgi:hypothetical protein